MAYVNNLSSQEFDKVSQKSKASLSYIVRPCLKINK